jgi:hypothetical protein
MRAVCFALGAAFMLQPLPLPTQHVQYLPAGVPLAGSDGLQGFQLTPVAEVRSTSPRYPAAFALGAVLGTLGVSLAVQGRQQQLQVKKALSQQEAQRRQFDAIVEANRKKKQRELQLQSKRAATGTASPAAKTQVAREQKKAISSLEAQRKQFDAVVEANRKKKQREMEVNNKRFAAGLPPVASTPARPTPAVRTTTTRTSTTRTTTTRAPAAQKSNEETPSQAFERIFAPVFIPPAVARKRPELVKKYQASGTPKTPTTTTRTTTARTSKPRVTKTVTKAKPRVTTSAARKTVSAARKPSRPRGVVKPTRVTKRASTTVRGVVKPTRPIKRTATKKTDSESPSKAFDRIFSQK